MFLKRYSSVAVESVKMSDRDLKAVCYKSAIDCEVTVWCKTCKEAGCLGCVGGVDLC